MNKIRFRHIYTVLFSILALVALLVSDPDAGFVQSLAWGAGFFATVVILGKIFIYVAMMHLSRRGLLDYIDLQKYFVKALEHPIGAGLCVVGVSVTMLAISNLIVAAVAR